MSITFSGRLLLVCVWWAARRFSQACGTHATCTRCAALLKASPCSPGCATMLHGLPPSMKPAACTLRAEGRSTARCNRRGVVHDALRATLATLLLMVAFCPVAGQTPPAPPMPPPPPSPPPQHPLVSFGAALAGGVGNALATWSGTTVCSGATTTTWAGVTCVASQPTAIALSGLGLSGNLSCAVASVTTLSSLDLVRYAAAC